MPCSPSAFGADLTSSVQLTRISSLSHSSWCRPPPREPTPAPSGPTPGSAVRVADARGPVWRAPLAVTCPIMSPRTWPHVTAHVALRPRDLQIVCPGFRVTETSLEVVVKFSVRSAPVWTPPGGSPTSGRKWPPFVISTLKLTSTLTRRITPISELPPFSLKIADVPAPIWQSSGIFPTIPMTFVPRFVVTSKMSLAPVVPTLLGLWAVPPPLGPALRSLIATMTGPYQVCRLFVHVTSTTTAHGSVSFLCANFVLTEPAFGAVSLRAIGRLWTSQIERYFSLGEPGRVWFRVCHVIIFFRETTWAESPWRLIGMRRLRGRAVPRG